MNPDIFQGQFTLKLIFDQREWIFEVYKRELPDLRYILQTVVSEHGAIRFEMIRTAVGRWMIVGNVPQVISDNAQEIGKAIA